jgi:hypothetical protein
MFYLLAYPHVSNHLGDSVIVVIDNVYVLLFPETIFVIDNVDVFLFPEIIIFSHNVDVLLLL